MSSILVTAFEPYDIWSTNASWLTLVEVTRTLAARHRITTRLYPVDYGGLKERMEADFQREFDVVLHLGQAPGSACLQFESVALNVASERDALQKWALAEDGPVAYQSALPLADFVEAVRLAHVPATVSYHAGTYLCNAAMYWSHYLAARRGYRTRSTMIHLPLETSQVVAHGAKLPSLPVTLMAEAIHRVLEQIRD